MSHDHALSTALMYRRSSQQSPDRIRSQMCERLLRDSVWLFVDEPMTASSSMTSVLAA
jgi:hypothetical protein